MKAALSAKALPYPTLAGDGHDRGVKLAQKGRRRARAAVARNGLASDTPGALTSAYVRARDADPVSSYGDFAAVSHPVDGELAALPAGLVCDGIVAPGYAPGTVATLSAKKNGRFLVLEADPAYVPPRSQEREVLGMRFTQARDEVALTPALLDDVVCGTVPTAAAGPTCCSAWWSSGTPGPTPSATSGAAPPSGVGAGQQSRVDCTRLAGAKTAGWRLRRQPALRAPEFAPGVRRQERINWQVRCAAGDLTPDENARLARALTGPVREPLTEGQRREWLARLSGVAFASDGALPFRDNVDHAARHGVRRIAEPGGSIRSGEVARGCEEHGIGLVRTGLRPFLH